VVQPKWGEPQHVPELVSHRRDLRSGVDDAEIVQQCEGATVLALTWATRGCGVTISMFIRSLKRVLVLASHPSTVPSETIGLPCSVST